MRPRRRTRPSTTVARRAALLAGGCGLALAVGHALGAPVATQLPNGGQVTAGAAAIARSGPSLTITQTTARAAIDWSTFDIGAAATVTFSQPSTASVTLNRVASVTPSQIFGRLIANGQVFLVNPGGVYFADGATVDVAGLVATSSSLDNAEFMAGANSFDSRGAQGSVINEGSLTARSGGYIALMAPTVRNTGVITASLGMVALMAGDSYTLRIDGANTLADVIVSPATMQALVENGGAARADGGRILLSAQAADHLLGGVVRTTGDLEADGIDATGGVIRLVASDHVVVGGVLSARGGTTGGDGGLVETSATSVEVAANAVIDTQAPKGQPGQWLVDPTTFTVAASGGNITGAQLASELTTTRVVIQTTSGDIAVSDPVTWSNNGLTLDAAGAIDIIARMAAIAAPLTMTSGAGAIAMGLSGSGFTGKIDFLQADGITPRSGSGFLAIDGAPYTVITALGAAGSLTGADLQGVNGALKARYALGSDIDATVTSTWDGGAGFTPLGGVPFAFLGTFNGLGHTITGLSVNRPTQDYVGLFGLAINASVSNIGLEKADIIGRGEVGGLVGRLWAYGSDAQAQILNSYVGGAVDGTYLFVGGLAGRVLASDASASGPQTSTLVGGSFSSASVTSSLGAVGGLVGVLDTGSPNAMSTITGSFATGAVTEQDPGGSLVGGLVGTANIAGPGNSHKATGSQAIIDSFATGSVGAADGTDGVGGLAGQISSTTVTNAFAIGSVTAGAGSKWVGALAGLVQASRLTSTFYDNQANSGLAAIGFNQDSAQTGDLAGAYWGMSKAQLKDPANFAGPTAANGGVDPGWASIGWGFDTAVNHGYPHLIALPNETAVTVYLLLLAGDSVYGATPNFTFDIYSNASGSGGAIVNDAVPQGAASWSTPLTAASAAGVYSETYVGGLTLGNTDYRLTPGAAVNWTIAKAPLTIMAADRTSTYGQVLPLGTTAFSSTGLVNGDTVTSVALTVGGSAVVSANTPAGSYDVAIANAAGAELTNYAVSYQAGKLSIAKALLTVSADNQTRPYGETDPTFTETLSGFVAGDSKATANITGMASGSTVATLASPAGVYPITGSTGTLQAANYVFTARDGTLTISPVPTPPPPPAAPAAAVADRSATAGVLPDTLSTPDPPPEAPTPPAPPPSSSSSSSPSPSPSPSPVAPASSPTPPPQATVTAAPPAALATSAPVRGGASTRPSAARACADAARLGQPCATRSAAGPAAAGALAAARRMPTPAAVRLARSTAATAAAAARGAEPAPGEPPGDSFRSGVWLDNASPFDAGKSRSQRELARDLNAASVVTTFTLFVLP